MSDYGNHPFLDPSRAHSYESVPPTAFVNPNEFAQEHDWFAVNEAVRMQMDRQAWDAAQTYGPSTGAYTDDSRAAEQEPDAQIKGLMGLTEVLIARKALGSSSSEDSVQLVLEELRAEDLSGVHRNLIIEFCSWWDVKLTIEVMERVGLTAPEGDPIYGAWFEITDRIEDRQSIYDSIPYAAVRNRMRLKALQAEIAHSKERVRY